MAGQEDGNHRQQEGRNPTGLARNSCRYSSVGDSYDGCNVQTFDAGKL